MGGLLKHARSLCALTNPSTNSYKRLVPGFEAPVTIGYATSNRSAVIRIPAYARSPKSKRFELRNPDATCNPYYAYSAILMAGIDGILNKIDPHENGWGPFDCNLYHLPEEERKKLSSLPRSLDEALDALEQDYEYLTRGGVFPKELLDRWINSSGRKRSHQQDPASRGVCPLLRSVNRFSFKSCGSAKRNPAGGEPLAGFLALGRKTSLSSIDHIACFRLLFSFYIRYQTDGLCCRLMALAFTHGHVNTLLIAEYVMSPFPSAPRALCFVRRA
jgi:hypothetical protein